MATSALALSTKDKAATTLNAGISAGATSIPLATGDGAKFPQPYNGTCSSGGTSTTLNSTGISAAIGGSAQVGKFIHNATDGSFAYILTVSTNSLTTTALLGGSNNTWNNGDAWRIDEFVVTFATLQTSAYNVITDTTAVEEALIIARSTDTLTVAAGGRGYNGTTAQTFNSGDAVQLRVTSPVHEGLRSLAYEIAKQLDTNTTNIGNLNLAKPFYAADTGAANAYAVTLSPAPTAYSAGMIVCFKAANASTTTSTLNVNALGTQTIKRLDGATNITTNDIKSGQDVICQYDGTNFQMLSPSGNAPLGLSQIGFYGDASSGTVTWSSNTNLNPASEFRYSTATLNSSTTLGVSSANTPLIIHCSSDVTINGTVDLNSQGGAGGAGGGSGATGTTGTAGNTITTAVTTGGGVGGGGNGAQAGSGGGGGASALASGTVGNNGTGSTGGSGGTAITGQQLAFLASLLRGVCCGAGGGGGGGGAATGGAGGAGGGALVWIIGGNLTLGASSIIRANGANGSAAGGSSNGGGGGGGGGTILIVVGGTITNSGTTLSATAGSGGAHSGGGGDGGPGAAGRVLIYSLSTGTLVTA